MRIDILDTEAAIAKREGRDYETAKVLLERIKKKWGEGEKKTIILLLFWI